MMNQALETPIQDNEVVVTFLNLLLTNEYVLYTKTRAANWIVNGSNYFELYGFLESQCNELDTIIDKITEKIHSLGEFESVFQEEFLSILQMSDDNHNFDNSEQIFETLANYHETIICSIQHEIFPFPDRHKVHVSVDFIVGLTEWHKNMIRILRLFKYNHEFSKNKQIRAINNRQSDELIKVEMEY